MEKNIKVTSDGWVWKIVQSPKELFSSGAISLYVLHEDDTESLVECIQDIESAEEHHLPIAISVGNPYTDNDMMRLLKSEGYCTDNLWHTIDVMMRYECTTDQAKMCLSWALDRITPEIHEYISSYMETYLNIKPKEDNL